MRRGDNGCLLYSALGGSYYRAIDENRIADLERLRLVVRTDEIVRTAFPVIGTAASAPLRRQARLLALKCLPYLIEPVTRISETLIASGFAGHVSAVVFGHALDGLMWTILAKNDAVPETRLTAERPFWNGTFWAIWPPRNEPSGVNEIAFPDLTLVMVWTPGTEPLLKALTSQANLGTMLRTMVSDAPSSPPTSAFNWLADEHGRPRVPIIRGGDALHRQSLALAQYVANTLLTERLPIIDGVDDSRDARVIFGHELIWEITELLRCEGYFIRPADYDPIADIFLRVEQS